MILFDGFIRNYENLGLNINSKIADINNKENKFFITLGKLLGFLVVSKKKDNSNLDLKWQSYELNNINTAITKISIYREIDLTKDLSSIHSLIDKVNNNTDKKYVQILEVTSSNRIEFLNKILISSINRKDSQILIIYITRNVIKNISEFNAYFFKNGEIIKNKVGISTADINGNYKATFKV